MTPQQQNSLKIVAWILGITVALFLGNEVQTRVFPSPRARMAFRTLATVGVIVAFFLGLREFVDDHSKAIDVAKGVVAFTAALLLFYESRRAGAGQPISERWKKFVGISLALAAISLYFHGYKFGYPHYFHRWDQYHYYMGAKYFREMGYDRLYKCSVIAQDELGVVHREPGDDRDFPNRLPLDMSKEVRHGDKKIRDLGGTNLLMPAASVLANPDECKKHFTPERWALYKRDVRYFRLSSDKTYWEDMQRDHGYNPPPVWTVAGKFFAELRPASMRYLQALAGLDVVYLAGTFLGLWWAFGWRVFAVAAIFWGCQHSAPFYWTGGALLRQDWLFFLIMAACLARKRYFKLAGASMVYAGLLRIFPGLAVIGWLGVAGWSLYRFKRLTRPQMQMLAGGVLAAAVLIPLSMAVSARENTVKGWVEPYKEFAQHTLKVHDQTPLTNHMGLRVIIGQKWPFEISGLGPVKLPPAIRIGTGKESGRMQYTKDNKLTDPFEVWKRMRNERYAKYKFVAYAVIAVTLGLFLYVLRRVKNMWVAQCLAQVFIILMSQLTCYYYSFMILSAPLTRLKREIELPLLGVAVLTQLIGRMQVWNDDKYWMLTAVSLVFCWWLLCAFTPKAFIERFRPRQRATA
jgi:hypothetical protein